MASQLQIYNLAFAHLAEPQLDTLTTDPPSANLRKANAQWPQALDVACATAPWARCTERLTVNRAPTPDEDAANGVAGDWAYGYVFRLPVETLRVFYVDDCDGAFAWEESRVITGPFVGRPVIRANTPGPIRVAITRRTIPELLSPLLCDALGYELASRLAGPIQSDDKKADYLREKAAKAYLKAMGSEATSFGGQDPLLGAPMAEARLRAGGGGDTWPMLRLG